MNRRFVRGVRVPRRAQIAGYLALADVQPTIERGMRAAGLIGLGAGVAPRIKALLPIGVRTRQLLVRTLLLGMLVVLADHRPAHLSRVHRAQASCCLGQPAGLTCTPECTLTPRHV